MKGLNSINTGLAALAVTAIFWAAPVKAQTYLRFNIPFQFAAGNEVLPAGQYEVVLDHFARIQLRNSAETTTHFVGLSTKSGRRSSSDSSQATLRFDRYAGTMFLTGAWARGQGDGRTVQPSGRLAEAMSASLNEGSPASRTLGSTRN